jgi:hypothetical protein
MAPFHATNFRHVLTAQAFQVYHQFAILLFLVVLDMGITGVSRACTSAEQRLP